MKQLLFLFVVLSSFSMPPVLVDDKKNDWVYELRKPEIKKPTGSIAIIGLAYDSPCTGVISCNTDFITVASYRRRFVLDIGFASGVHEVFWLEAPANIQGMGIFMYPYAGQNSCSNAIVSSSANWYVGD